VTAPLRTEEQQLRIRKNEEPGFFPLSYSRIKTFKDCEQRYKYENIDKLGRISGEAADLGSAAHVFQEVMFTDGIEAANTAARAMVPLAKSQDWLNAKNIIESIVIKKDYLFGAELVMHWEFPATKTTYDRSGADFEVPHIVQIESKIDQLFVYSHLHSIEIIDGKSGAQVPNEKELQDDPQGKLYAIVVLENIGELGIEKVTYTQAQWKYGRLVTVQYSIDELMEYRQQVMAIAHEMINEQEFAPEPNTHCHWCPFVLNCQAAQKMLPDMVRIAGIELPPVITTDEQAEKIAKGVLHLEVIAKRYRAALRGYTKETKRNVSVGEKGGWGWFKRSTLKIADFSLLFETAIALGIKLDPYLSFNNKVGKTLVKNNPTLMEGLVEEQYPFFQYRSDISKDLDD
jgi:hypothetical protein